ncbi:MAG: hypothetical protein V1716_05115 [Candidatus Uhrbacteria bacterium]
MTIFDIITAVGIPSIIVGLIFIGKKLQILDDLNLTVEKIKNNVKVVGDFLTRNSTNFNVAELQTYSPLTLTPGGEEFIKTIGFNNVFNTNKTEFFGFIDSEKPKLKYDVEFAAIRCISSLYDQDIMNFLKVFFYNNPSRNLENTAPTLGVYVRDKYLAEHPEITE